MPDNGLVTKWEQDPSDGAWMLTQRPADVEGDHDYVLLMPDEALAFARAVIAEEQRRVLAEDEARRAAMTELVQQGQAMGHYVVVNP